MYFVVSFSAPEVLKLTSYGAEVDMWSVGVIAYILYVSKKHILQINSVPGLFGFLEHDLVSRITIPEIISYFHVHMADQPSAKVPERFNQRCCLS